MEEELRNKILRTLGEKTTDEPGSSNNNNKVERKFTWGKRLNEGLDKSGKFIKTVAELPSFCTNPNEEPTEIQQFYKGANVFITGATGFIGKLLIEKLLVSCPDIGKFYLLIREKKGKTSEQRFDDLFSDYVFTRLHKVLPNFRSKLVLVNGDVGQPNLGMSEFDYDTIAKEVSIIFHGAATVRFDEALKSAVNINVKGVEEILKLAKKCKSLKSFIHVSTAFSNCTLPKYYINEEFFPVAYNHKDLFHLIETKSDEELEKLTPSLIRPWPNTYCYTKQIAEDVIRKEGQGLPLAVVRPAIIIATYKEPVRGWTDNIYGPTGVLVGAGMGVLRVMKVDYNVIANVVPVDLVVNNMIVAAWKACQNFRNGKKNIDIYNFVSEARNPVSWGEYSYWNSKYGLNWPTSLAIWYIIFYCTKNKYLFLLLSFIFHTVPAYAIDGVLYLSGKKPKMIKLYKKISKFIKVLEHFSLNTWNFSDENVQNLWNSLSPKDQELYPFDIANMDWDYHTEAHVLGVRVHLLKDDLDTVEKANKKWQRLKYLHYSLKTLLILFFSWIVYRLFIANNNA